MTAVARGARTNLALLLLLAAAFLTGWLAFAFATAPSRWSLIIHATSGFAIIALLPWKSMVARRGMRRAQPARWASILFGVLVIVSLGAGLLQSTGIALSIGPFSAMDFHVGGAIATVPFAIWHIAVRRIKLRPADMSRRAAVRGGAVLAGRAPASTQGYGLVPPPPLPPAPPQLPPAHEPARPHPLHTPRR